MLKTTQERGTITPGIFKFILSPHFSGKSQPITYPEGGSDFKVGRCWWEVGAIKFIHAKSQNRQLFHHAKEWFYSKGLRGYFYIGHWSLGIRFNDSKLNETLCFVHLNQSVTLV